MLEITLNQHYLGNDLTQVTAFQEQILNQPNYLPLKEGVVLHFNKFESPLLEYYSTQLRFLKFSIYFYVEI